MAEVATKASKAALVKELADRELARRRLVHFTKRLNHAYKDGWVHRDICRRLEQFSDDVMNGLSPRLMLLMPPRHGKSELASRNFPAWHLGRASSHEFIAASYNVSLAMGFSKKVQGIMNDVRYPFESVRIDPNNQSAETWGLVAKAGEVEHVTNGGYVAAGVGGGITGKGAHILLIDDPIKNAEEADSLVTREALWEWYTSTAYTRLAPGGGVLVIQTCWHDDDLAGRLQQIMAANPDDPDVDNFEIVKYPAIAEADEWLDEDTDQIIRIEHDGKPTREDVSDYLEALRAQATARAKKPEYAGRSLTLLRAKGEPLHPERYDIKKLLKIKRTLPVRFWSALYQQNPVPDDGSFFMRDQFRQLAAPLKQLCNVYLTADFAINDKQHNDFTVIRVGLHDEYDMLHYVDFLRLKSNDPKQIITGIITLMKRWYQPGMRAGFENGQIFLAIKKQLEEAMKKERLFIPYETLQPVTDKKVRATPLQGRMQHGRVSFAAGAEWFPVVQAEYLRFPNGVHDDIVDADAWMARMVELHAPPRARTTSEKVKSWRDRLPKTAGARSGSHMRN